MNILIHATLYPEYREGKRPNTTLFIHYYAAEWVKQGHNVLVIHHKAVFPEAVVSLCRLYGKTKLPLSARVRDYLNGYGTDEDTDFVRDGVRICRRSIVKAVPRTLYPKGAIARRAKECEKILKEYRFTPDVILADFINPGLFTALSMHSAPVGAVLHDTDLGYLQRGITRRQTENALKQADFLVFRSRDRRADFEKRYFKPAQTVIMSSGLPADYRVEKCVRTRVRSFLCAARLVPLKRVDTVIRAFGKLDRADVTLTVVGDGVEEASLKTLAKAQPNGDRIRFAGRLTREETMKTMLLSDCFVLVSASETFGMVYVEALSTGSVVIGSAGQGCTDFIRDGETGYLAASSDADALAERMRSLTEMSEEDISALSERGMKSVAHLRDDLLSAEAAKQLADIKRM